MISKAKIFENMVKIRTFEEGVQELFEKKILHGTAHLCIGQEANAVAAMHWVQHPFDYVFSHHRGHGHYLAYSSDYSGLLCELAGIPEGCCGGYGGSQHLHRGNFFSNGILGSTVPWATGAAYGIDRKMHCYHHGEIVFCWMTDGMMGQGVVYEALRMAEKYQVPCLYILENNHYAISTPAEESYKDVIEGLHLKYTYIKERDPMKIIGDMKKCVDFVREYRKPLVVEINTFRFCGHSKSDNMKYMDKKLFDEYKASDPFEIMKNILGRRAANIIAEATNEICDLLKKRIGYDLRKSDC